MTELKNLPENIKEFIKFCEKSNYPVITLLETDLKGQTVSNDMGMDFELRQYASINVSDKNYTAEEMEIIFKYKNQHNLDIMLFFPIDNNNQDLIQELWVRDKYKVIYEKK